MKESAVIAISIYLQNNLLTQNSKIKVNHKHPENHAGQGLNDHYGVGPAYWLKKVLHGRDHEKDSG